MLDHTDTVGTRGPSSQRAHPPLGPVAALLVLPAILVMLWRVGSPTYGAHAFRQSHVVANVELFVREGLSWIPSTYNDDVPGRVFDWPVYELLSAIVSQWGVTPTAAARAVSVVVQIGILGLSWTLLKRDTPSSLERLSGLAFLAYSPLQLFFGSAPLPDGLALAAAYGSAVCLLDGSFWARTLLGCALGACATAIKAPVYLPVLVGLLWESLWLRASRRVVASLAACGSAGLALVATRKYGAAANAGLNTTEAQDYFGSLAARASWEGWSAVASHAVFLAIGPIVAILAVIGLARCRRTGFLVGLGVGSVVTLLIFFSRFQWHSYYHLPLTLPFACLGAAGLGFLHTHLRGARRQVLLPPVLLAHLVITTVPGVQSQVSPTTRELVAVAAGRWLQTVTSPNEYVIYVVDSFERDWSPLFLSEARRRGCNVSLTQIQRGFLTRVRTEADGRFAQSYVFCPPGLPPWVARKLESFGLAPVAKSSAGVLYSFRDGGER